MRILFDATTALQWASRPPIGSVRVERLVLGELFRRLPESDLLLIKYRAGRFMPLTSRQAALVRDAVSGEPPVMAPRRPRRPWRRWLKAASGERPRALPDLGGYTDLISMGHGWDYLGHEALAALRADRRLRLLGFIHDLIVVDRPHYHYDPATADRLRRHHAEFCRLADLLLVNSQATRASLERFIAGQELRRPDIRTVTLPACVPGSGDGSARPAPVGEGPFVLYVSTLEIRKNHRLLLRLWSEAARAGIDLPRLVLVGQVGWGAEEALRMLGHDPALKGRVVHLASLPDGALARLYRDCLFTLYPSFVEGWGLPIAESLSAGKACIHADDPAQREAAQDLGICLDPDDHRGWQAAILGLARDALRRARLEATIRDRYRVRTTEGFGAELAEALGLP